MNENENNWLTENRSSKMFSPEDVRKKKPPRTGNGMLFFYNRNCAPY